MPLVARVLDGVDDDEMAFQFGNGSLALDLVATVGERWRRCFERLRDPSDLRRWLDEVGLTDCPNATEDDVTEFRRLRSAIFDLVEARRRDMAPPRGPYRLLNSVASGDPPVPRLTRSWEAALYLHSLDPVRTTIARDAITLLTEVDPGRMRECAAPDCSRLFVDRSRPGRRRWCESTGCGNRAKVAAYRKRRSAS